MVSSTISVKPIPLRKQSLTVFTFKLNVIFLKICFETELQHFSKYNFYVRLWLHSYSIYSKVIKNKNIVAKYETQKLCFLHYIYQLCSNMLTYSMYKSCITYTMN